MILFHLYLQLKYNGRYRDILRDRADPTITPQVPRHMMYIIELVKALTPWHSPFENCLSHFRPISLGCSLIIGLTTLLACSNTELSSRIVDSDHAPTTQKIQPVLGLHVEKSATKIISTDTLDNANSAEANLSSSTTLKNAQIKLPQQIEDSRSDHSKLPPYRSGDSLTPTALPAPTPTALPAPTPTALPAPTPTALPAPTPSSSNKPIIKFDSNLNSEKLSPIGIAQGYNSGKSASVGDSLILIGSPKDSHNVSNSGAGYVFVESGDSWSQQAKLTPTDGRQSDQFGTAVAIAGDYAIVGAPYSDSGATDAGATYVFNAGAQ